MLRAKMDGDWAFGRGPTKADTTDRDYIYISIAEG